jgi:hypothetical protein
MRAPLVLAFASAVALIGGAAFAQSVAATDAPAAATSDASTSLPAADQVDLKPAGGFASSDTLGDPSKLKAGDPNVVSNAPVPDTHDNRVKFGRPMSTAGRKSAATGD